MEDGRGYGVEQFQTTSTTGCRTGGARSWLPPEGQGLDAAGAVQRNETTAEHARAVAVAPDGQGAAFALVALLHTGMMKGSTEPLGGFHVEKGSPESFAPFAEHDCRQRRVRLYR